MNAFLVDISIIIIICMFISSGFKNGMIKSFLLLINSVLSWVFSVYISKFISYFICNRFIRPSVIRKVDGLLKNKNLKEDVIFNKLPKVLVNWMSNYGITTDKFTHIINSVSKEVLPNEIYKILMPIISEILEFLITSIVFIIFLLLGKTAIGLILKLFKLKIINFSDKVIGGIFGGLKGYIIILIFTCILKILVPLSFSNSSQKFISKTISSTIILKSIYRNNPLYNIFKKL